MEDRNPVHLLDAYIYELELFAVFFRVAARTPADVHFIDAHCLQPGYALQKSGALGALRGTVREIVASLFIQALTTYNRQKDHMFLYTIELNAKVAKSFYRTIHLVSQLARSKPYLHQRPR
mgnify:CR=1 FL=1